MLSTSSRSVRTLNQVLVAALLTLSTTLVAAKDNGAAAEKAKLSVSVSAKTKAAPAVKAADAMARVPLAFEANQGQVDKRVEYFSRGAGYTLFLTKDEAVLSLANAKGQPDVLRVKLTGADAKSKVSAIERLGWNNNYFIGKDPAKWRTNVPNYRKVEFDNVYPGVSLVYYGNQRQMEHDFVVAPDADAKKIAMEIAGASDLTIDSTGNLVIKTTRGEVRFEKPVIYQDVNGARKDVAGKFILRDQKSVGFEIADYDRSKALVIDPVINFGTLLSASVGVSASGVAVDGAGNSYVTGITQATSFPAPAPAPGTTAAVGPSDDVYVVKVSADGSSLGYVSFIGSSGTDFVNGIALDGSNNAYITGQASCTVAGTSTDFPTTTDAFQQSGTCPGSDIGYVTKLNPTGSALLYSTLFGGDGVTHGIAIGTSGAQAFITGTTSSSATPLPVSGNAFQVALAGTQDAFLAQIDTASLPNTNGATCDGAGNDTIDFGVAPTFVVGEQVTISGITAVGATVFNTAPAHAKITAVGATTITYADASCANAADTGTAGTGNVTGGLVYGSYLGGGAGASVANAIAVGGLNSVFVGGVTTSAAFPTVAGAQPAPGGGSSDGFVSQFNPTNPVAVNSVPASTYVGGSASDQVNALALDGLGNLYAAGFTASTDFPNTAGGAQAVHGVDGGGNDAFVTMLPISLASFTQSTYLGGSGSDQARAISINGTSVWVAGTTGTPTADNVFNVNSFPGVFLTGLTDGFITKFNSALTGIDVSTYFGGNGNNDSINGLVATGADTVVVAGNTDSTDFYAIGGTTGAAFQTVPASSNPAGFAAKFSANNTAITLTPDFFNGTAPTTGTDPLKFDGTNNSDYTINLTNNDPAVNATKTTLDLHMDLTKLAINSITPTPNTIQCTTGQANANSGITCDAGTISAAGGTASVVVNVSAIPCAGAPTCPATTAVTNVSAASAETGSTSTSTITSNILPVADIQLSGPIGGVNVVDAASNNSGANKFVLQKDTSYTYTYKATNLGPNDSGTFDITNTLPAGFTATTVNINVTTGTATSATCDAQAGTTIACHVNGLSNLGVVTISVAGDPTSLLLSTVPSTTNQLDFSAAVTITGATYIDPAAANDTASNTGATLERDVALSVSSMTSAPNSSGLGNAFVLQTDSTISYVVTGNNAGPSDSTNTVLTVNFPVGSSLGAQPGACGGGSAFNAGTGVETCNLGTVANGASPAVTFVVTPPALGANTPSTVLAATSALSTTSANNTAGGTGSVNTTQERVAVITVSTAPQAAGSDTAEQQVGQVTYTMKAHNAGPSDATNVRLQLTLDTGAVSNFTAISGTDGAAGCGAAVGQTVTCTSATPITAGSDYVVTFQATSPATINGNAAPATQAFNATNNAIADTFPVSVVQDVLGGPAVASSAHYTATIERRSDLSVGALTATAGPTSISGSISLDLTAGSSNTNYAIPGTTVVYTLTPTNPATSFTSGGGVQNGSTTGAACVNTTPAPAASLSYTCTIANLANAGQAIHLVINAPITDNVSAGTVSTAAFTSSACIAGPVTNASDPGNSCALGGNNVSTTAGADPSSQIQRQADLDISAVGTGTSFAGAPGTVSLAGPLTYTYRIRNNGPDTALNVLSTITETSSAVNTPLIVGAFSGATSCSLNGANIDCSIASIPATGSVLVTVPITPPLLNSMTLAGGAAKTDTLSAVVALDPQVSTTDTTAGNNSNGTTVNTTLQRTADVNIAGTAFTATRSAQAAAFPNAPGVNSGTTITTNLSNAMSMTFGLTNAGPDAALNVPVTLTNVVGAVATPISITSSTGNACSLVAGNIQCLITTVPTAGTTNITVNFVPMTPNSMTLAGGASASGSFTTTAAITAPGSYVDGTPANDTNASTVTTNLLRESDIQLNFVGDSFTATSPVDLSGQITYTYNYKNAGPDPALKLATRISIGAGAFTTPASFVTAGSTVDIGGGPIPLAAAATNGCVFSSSTTLDCEVDGPIPVGAAPPGFVVNTTVPLTASMNAGASNDATTNSLAASSASVFDDGAAGAAGANNAFPLSRTIVIQRVTDLAINSLTAAPNVSGSPNPFVVTKDSTITYSFVVQNNGPEDSPATVLSIPFPSGSTLTGGQPAACGGGSSFNAGTAVETCNIGTLTVAAGATTINFVVTPPALAPGTASVILSLLNANISGGAVDNTSANNSASIAVTQERDINLQITAMTETPNVNNTAGHNFVVNQDSTITYGVTVQNAGPSDATNTVLTINLTPGSTFTNGSAAGCAGGGTQAGNAITCNLSTLTVAAGAVPLSFVITPPALAANSASTPISASATITTNPISANNTSTTGTATSTTTEERDVNLTIPTMTATPNVNNTAGHAFVVGQDSTISYALSVQNSGPSDATNVVLTLNLPVGSALTGGQPAACGGASAFNAGTGVETCDVGTLTVAAGATPIAFVVTPPALAAATPSTTLFASASMNTASGVNSGSASNSASTIQERDADLGVTISVPATTLSVGPGFDSVSNGHQQVTYTIVATNNGPSDATNVKVTDVLPAGFNFTSFTSTLGGVTCSGAGAPVTVTCDFGATVLVNGGTNTITITATATAASLPAAQTTNVVSNNASIASTTLNDPTPGNNSTTVPALVTLHGEADISISGITATPASGATLHVGDDLIYGVTVHNAGPHPTQLNLAFSDVLPAGVTPVSVTPGSGTTNCVLGATTTCTMTTGLAIGGSETINIRVHVPAAAVGALNSNATVDTPANPVADEEDSALGNNTLGNSTTAVAAADLQLTEAAVPNPTLAGTSTTFTVTIANLAPPAYVAGSPVVGGSNATGITVRNVVTVTPASPTIAISSITNNFGATCPASATLTGGTATINCTGGNVTSGASNTITLTTTPSVIGTLTNVATITAANEFDPVAGNNTITVTDREDNTPVCSGAGCTAITPVDPVSGNSPLSLPQAATVQFTNVTTQGSTTMTVAAQPASCQILDSTSLPAGSTLINNSTHVPFHGILPYTGSRTYACGSGAPLFYNISTTATASGTANVCVNYSGTTFHKADRVRLVEVSGAAAQDITIASGFSATSICGQLPSFSSASGTVTVAVMEPSNAMPDLTAATATPNNTAAARGAAGNAVDLSAAGTFDNDGPDKCVTGTCSDTLTYRWFSTGFLGSSTVLGKTVTVPVSATGTVNILLTATDPYGDSETRLFTLTFTGTLGSGSSGSSGGFVTSASVNKGQAASFTTALDNPTGGAVTLFVSNAATLANSQIVCTISPNTLPAGSTGTAVTVLCSTQGQIFAKMDTPQRGMGKDEVPMLAGMVGITALPLMGMLLMPGKSRRKKLLKMWAAIGLVLMFTMFQAACGGGGASSFGGAPTLKNAGTPAGTYQVVIASNPAGVTGSSAVTTGTVAGSTTFTLTVQ